MVKNEQFRNTDQLKRLVSSGPMASLPVRPPMFQSTSVSIPQRSIDPRAIDISSIKGRFAWEKIALGDTYIPVIFRGTTKYFCVKMLHKLLPDYPEDVIRRSSYYQYRKPVDSYIPTLNELDLLNRINAHHARWAYSRQSFTATDELVRVSDFLPFYEYLRLVFKTPPIPRSTSSASLRPILPQPQQSPDFVVNTSNTARRNSTVSVATTSIQIQPYATSELPRENIPTVPRPIALAPAPSALYPSRSPKSSAQPLATARRPSQKQLPPSSTQQSIVTPSNSLINSTNTIVPNKSWTVPALIPSLTSTPPPRTISNASLDSVVSSPMSRISRKLSITSSENQLTPISNSSSSSSPSASKPARLHSGWLQINKLYTPYVSANTSHHHLYKIPVSLLTFYDLLKIPSLENNSNESKDSSFSFEQTLVTPQEIELINELCLKQNIKPFSIDTKLINLATFYQYCSANILFVKELPLIEPKASICKEWPSIVQINGGICRLRNIATLHEQTVPFIGNNLLKNFVISSQCLSTASLTTPTTSEMKFLQLILFFSNISINIRNAKLIDIESVQKEYNVDLILLFNDKFPSNVLNYQQQGNRPSASQEQVNQSDSSAATNTFAESTPPPSPLSPPTNNTHANPTSQLPLTSSSNFANRYQKPITFHGHSMTAYICSGIGSNAQRECISVKALCTMLYPNSSILDKLETRMLRLLRLKNINRFRPQNQQAMGFTRLIDVKDVEKHWDYIENGMRSLPNNDGETNVVREVSSSLADKDLKASTVDKVENNCKNTDEDTSMEVNKREKRPLEREMADEEDAPVLERTDKRVRVSGEDQNELSKLVRSPLIKTNNQKKNHSDDDESDDDSDDDDDDEKPTSKTRRYPIPTINIAPKKNNMIIKRKSIPRQNDRISSKSTISSRKQIVSIKKKIKIRKRPTPRIRSNQIIAAWVKKYDIEDCCIRLDLYRPISETGRD